MSSEIKPALTAEEWALPLADFCHERVGYTCFSLDLNGEPSECLTLEGEVYPADRLALAARWLHEAGWFTHEDVMVLRDGAHNDQPYPTAMRAARYRDIAGRLAALLPPEGKEVERADK